MKTFVSKVLILAFVLTLAVSAFAANATTIRLPHEATIQGTKLPAGEYKVTVDGTGAEVKVTFAQGKKVVATVTGKTAEGQIAPEWSAVVTNKAADGTLKIEELRIAAKKTVVRFE